MDALIFKIGLFVFLFILGWSVGRYVELKHLKQLDEQEQRLRHIQLDVSRFKTSVDSGQLISSNVVISHDYFKMVIANIQNFFGGRLTAYESVVERARREAVIRLKLEAEKMGATQILGLRLSTSELGMQGGMVEVFAYGTAIVPTQHTSRKVAQKFT
ncbi:uncharacterized protein YbjQ (UPF0145 family) [Acinetobacter calcoaceticus]|uniref:Uncharacterized protein YbjQ (UPF0145 family) n=1 Tax=Acinetobacter calcoaceticus TaxID=471 RepID=A0A4V2R1S8_ACICA|nr:uncharacterized protein YbjQ (UPF0145 family) [Acinetobacter calcoaceticus]